VLALAVRVPLVHVERQFADGVGDQEHAAPHRREPQRRLRADAHARVRRLVVAHQRVDHLWIFERVDGVLDRGATFAAATTRPPK
jgi:hypothetical protein